MQKILSITIPGLLIFGLTAIDHFMLSQESLYLLVWIYAAFPIIFIFQGIACSGSGKNMIIGMVVSAAAVVIPVAMWYNVGSVIIPVMVYLLLGVIMYFLTSLWLKGGEVEETEEVE